MQEDWTKAIAEFEDPAMKTALDNGRRNVAGIVAHALVLFHLGKHREALTQCVLAPSARLPARLLPRSRL